MGGRPDGVSSQGGSKAAGPRVLLDGGVGWESGQNFLQMALCKAGGVKCCSTPPRSCPEIAAVREDTRLHGRLGCGSVLWLHPSLPLVLISSQDFPLFFPCLLCLSLCAPSRSRSMLSVTSHITPAHPHATVRGNGSVTTLPQPQFPALNPSQQSWAAPVASPGVIFIIE